MGSLRTAYVDALEPRCLLAISPVPANLAVPFTRVVIDANPANRPLEKVLVDLNNDGRLDIVTGHTLNGGMYWYQHPAGGPTAGTWTKRTIISSGDFYEDMVPFDLNADGHRDIIASYGNTVTWFQNPGNGGVGTWTTHQIGNLLAHDMVITDFDGDAKIDIATNNSIYFQNTPTSWTTVRGANYPRIGDGVGLLDTGHGRRDLIGSGTTSAPYSIKWYENPRNHGGNARTDPWIARTVGSLWDPNYSKGGLTYDSVDLNSDGRVDILTAQNEQPDDFAPPPAVGIAWYEAPTNPLTATSWTKRTIDSTISQVHKTRFADFNGDGRIDIAYAQQEQSPQDRLGIITSADNGAGNNWYNQVLTTASGHNIYVADVEGDGDADILNAPHSVYGAPKVVELWVNQRSSQQNVAPTITQQPISRIATVGQSVSFTVAATGSGTLGYQWQRNQVPIPGATSSTFTIPSVTLNDDNDSFRAIVTNAYGSATSAAATLTVANQQSTGKFLSDLTPTFASNGFGPYERDRSNGESGANDGRTITLNGVTYQKGLGVHANSELRYNMAGQYRNFVADIGVDDEVGSAGSVQFRVFADEVLLFQSATMTGSSATQSINVNVAGRNVLKLVVTDTGNGNSSDHADWANARLTTKLGPSPVPPSKFQPDLNGSPSPRKRLIADVLNGEDGSLVVLWE